MRPILSLLFIMLSTIASSYAPATTTSRNPATDAASAADQLQNLEVHDLVQYATMAASSHNTQCWKFRVGHRQGQEHTSITVVPDLDRTCPVVDPDNHHLFVSLGCAVENLVVAARGAYGYHQTHVDASDPANGISVQLLVKDKDEDQIHDGSNDNMNKNNKALFEAIPQRQVTRSEYDGKPLSASELHQLEQAGTGKGVRVLLVTDRADMDTILDYIIDANTDQMTNPAFLHELSSWLRFNNKDATAHGDGLHGACFGNPQAPAFVGKFIFQLVAKPRLENKKIVKQVQSSAGFAIFISEQDDPVHWVEVGRCYESFALTATALGVRNAFLNQPVEEHDVRPAFAKALGLMSNERPDLIVRFGKGKQMPFSPRRPVEDVFFEVDGQHERNM